MAGWNKAEFLQNVKRAWFLYQTLNYRRSGGELSFSAGVVFSFLGQILENLLGSWIQPFWGQRNQNRKVHRELCGVWFSLTKAALRSPSLCGPGFVSFRTF
jgi:hypothetical protein